MLFEYFAGARMGFERSLSDKLHRLLYTGNCDLWSQIRDNIQELLSQNIQFEFAWVKAHANKHKFFFGYVSEADHFGNTLADVFSGQAASLQRCDVSVRDRVSFVLGRSKIIRDRLVDVLRILLNFEPPE